MLSLLQSSSKQHPGHPHDVQFTLTLIFLIHWLFVLPFIVMIVLFWVFPVLIVTSGYALVMILGVGWAGLVVTSVMIGVIVAVMGAVSIVKVVTTYSTEIVFLIATFIEMLVWSGVPFPVTYLFYFLLVFDPTMFAAEGSDDILA